MNSKHTIKSWLTVLIFSVILNACGGGGGGSSEPKTRSVGTLVGDVFDAPVSGTTVSVWEYQDGKLGKLLAKSITDALGHYSAEVSSGSMSLLVVAEGGSYEDPMSHEIVAHGANGSLRMESVINYSEGEQQNLMITPLTNMAAGLAEYNIAHGESAESAVSKSLATIDEMYGIDVNSTEPVDITKRLSGSISDGHKYGALLTAYSVIANDAKKGSSDGDSKDVYTSINLSDIEYQDIVADGKLDGYGVNPSTGIIKQLSYGREQVTSDLYTNELAQHILIVVNDPELNVSGTQASEYQAFSEHINELGTPGHDSGAMAPRPEKPIDTSPPVVKRSGSATLAGREDSIDFNLTDDIGVADVSALLQYCTSGCEDTTHWIEVTSCPAIANGVCQLNLTDFTKGVRATSASVTLDTTVLDEVDGGLKASQARLLVYSSDVMGNKSESGTAIPFTWDNDAPVIEFTSSDTISNGTQAYTLEGVIKGDLPKTVSVSIAFRGEKEGDDIPCTLTLHDSGYWCEFKGQEHRAEDFIDGQSAFDVTAIDQYGNQGESQYVVSQDNTPPEQQITYPNSEMNFLDTQGNADDDVVDNYTASTYTSGTIDGATRYLKIDYKYAKDGLKGSIPNVDFANFTVDTLKTNKIPYIKVVVDDPDSNGLAGSSAEKLTLHLTYSYKKDGEKEYGHTKSFDSSDTDSSNSKFPHEKLVYSADNRVSQVVYYIPFVKEVLGNDFISLPDKAEQRLDIQTEDGSKNTSEIESVYFKTTFDLPTIKVVTPFFGVRAQLEALNDDGKFVLQKSCSTSQEQEPNGDSSALDVASCSLFVDSTSSAMMRVRLMSLTSDSGSGDESYYYQWKDDTSMKKTINLDSANLGAYFQLNGSETLYITELSAYQTGLFDSLWNASSSKTEERAIQYLEEVNSALASTASSASFFGFNPILTQYATNQMLRDNSSYDLSDPRYRHRFLVESLEKLAEDNGGFNTSVDYAEAFYDDLSADGKPDGVGSNGQSVSQLFNIQNYEISEKTYRTDLAKAFYDLVTEQYGVSPSIALSYADGYAMANPSLNGQPLFEDDGKSIDTDPPKVTLEIKEGSVYKAPDGKSYIAGDVQSELTVSDASALLNDNGEIVKMLANMYSWEQPNTPQLLADFPFVEEKDKSSLYSQSYRFELNTNDYPEMSDFEVLVSAKDVHNNSIDNDSHSLYIDNDYPEVTYTPPTGIDNQTPQTSFINANGQNILTFHVQDRVGDDISKRELVLVDKYGHKVVFSADKFLDNSAIGFTVNLCLSESCTKGIYPFYNETPYSGDGEWTAYVDAVDYLGNQVTETTSDAPQFMVDIDSQAPEIVKPESAPVLGGNSTWLPASVIHWKGLSPSGKVEVTLRKTDGQSVDLKICSGDKEACPTTHLTGEQPDVKVQLVASDFLDDNGTNTFTVVASDSAIPANVSAPTDINFIADIRGPEIHLAQPWLTDAQTQESFVLGKTFSVNINSLQDQSSVASVALYQAGSDTPLKEVKNIPDPSQGLSFAITPTESEKIDISQTPHVSLYLKATDVNGFESTSNTADVLMDFDAPQVGLSGYDKDAYYRGSYEFLVDGNDLDQNGNPSSQGVDTTKSRYWIVAANAPKPDESQGGEVLKEGKVVLSNLSQDSTIWINETDVRGNQGDTAFNIKVDNSLPQVELSVQYADGSPIDNYQVTDASKDLTFTLIASAVSGIVPPSLVYYPSGDAGQSHSHQFVEDKIDNLWTLTLPADAFPEDGDYDLTVDVISNTKYLKEEEKPLTTEHQVLHVQRKGIELNVVSPASFSDYMAGTSLAATFTQLEAGDKAVQTLECWVRDNYQSDEAPADSGPYSGVINHPQSLKCHLAFSQSYSNPVLITRTVGDNGAEQVQRFDFKMVDVNAPTVVTPASYLLTGKEVWNDSDGDKMLSLKVTYQDVLSGVNISSSEAQPYLETEYGKVKTTPASCQPESGNAGQVTCEYVAKYSQFISPLDQEHRLVINNLSDNVGNSAQQSQIQLIVPEGSVDVQITRPSRKTVIAEGSLSVDFRFKLPTESDRLQDIEADIAGTKYTLTDSTSLFTELKACDDDTSYFCTTFTAQLPKADDGAEIAVTMTAEDVWGKRASDSSSVIVDTQGPQIGSGVNLSQVGDKARFDFDVSDQVSGVASVEYTITPDGQHKSVQTIEEDGSGNSGHFDITSSELENTSKVSVTIKATDNVGLVTTVSKILENTRNFSGRADLGSITRNRYAWQHVSL